MSVVPKHWTRVEATPPGDSSRRPHLIPNETLLLMQRGVGLYDGAIRAAAFDTGALWVTTHRLVWVDAGSDIVVALDLARVDAVSATGGFAQYMPVGLKSSPKITLTLTPVTAITTTVSEPFLTTQLIQVHAANAAATRWTCEICDTSNDPSKTMCDECGVKRPVAATNVAAHPALPSTPESSEKACPVCTFINHTDVIFCEACESRFPAPPPKPLTGSTPTPASPLGSAGSISSNHKEDLSVKLSFRSGGLTDFLKALKGSMAAKEWEKSASRVLTLTTAGLITLPSGSLEKSASSLVISGSSTGGISGIIKKADQTNQVYDKTLSTAFHDLDALMSKASDMVKLAESISSRLSSGAAGGAHSSLDDPELIAFRSFLVDLGIPSPVTKEMTGDAYTEELAKELSDFLSKVIRQYGGMIALTDLYCLFNRARGVALISPQDLQKSVSQFEFLRLPFRVRKFDSGLLVVHSSDYSDDAIATRILAHVKQAGGESGFPEQSWGLGMSALDIASREGVSLILAKELLLITEKYGLICRDDSVEGLRFYDNVFTMFQ
ncbi:EAP30/Vps36 family-domain-containing protein [Chytriomyces sp. MP71]|nr:EAP30/Vps36 family-domain-containing protein [Chytriomyces sp. MP71]